VPRPKFSDDASSAPVNGQADEGDGDEHDHEDQGAESSSRLDRFKYGKKNHEATSEEDE